MKQNNFTLLNFYKFVDLHNPKTVVEEHSTFCKNKILYK
jgi:predicted sulfurtransferase